MTAVKTWADSPMSPFDVESSGANPEEDRIVTATVMTIVGSMPRVRSWLVDPGVDIPDEAAAIHGITTEHARAHGTPAAEAIQQIRDAIVEELYAGNPLVIYNAPFDLTMLDRECRRHGIEPVGAARVPLRVIARWAENFEAFKRSQGEDVVIPRFWPVVPFERVGAEA